LINDDARNVTGCSPILVRELGCFLCPCPALSECDLRHLVQLSELQPLASLAGIPWRAGFDKTLNGGKIYESREASGFSCLREAAVRERGLEVGGLRRSKWKK